jgi:hypothetical protein
MNLNEWVDSKGNTIAPGAVKNTKQKFTSLVYYMMKNKGSLVSKAEVVRLDSQGFTYKEYHKSTSGQDYVLTLLVGGFSRGSSSWAYELYLDTNLVNEARGSGWEDLLEALEKYFHVPKVGSKEYESLCEWLDAKGNKINPNNTSTVSSQPATSSTNNYPSQKENYERLLKQIDADRVFRNYTVNHISDRLLELTAGNGVEVDIIYKPYVPCYIVNVSGSEATCNSWKEVLKHLLIEGIIGDTDLCESASSIVEDFRAYEDLWN